MTTLFANPQRIETLSAASWDWEVQDALLHARGAGVMLPEPEVRFWTFPNGLGVAARLSRDLLLVGMVHYDVWVYPLTGPPIGLTGRELKKRGLQVDFEPRENLTPEEVNTFLARVKVHERGGTS